MTESTCEWEYRPGIGNTHWALTTCSRGFNYLSRLNLSEPAVGCADFYNGRICPICGKTIKVTYSYLIPIHGRS